MMPEGVEHKRTGRLFLQGLPAFVAVMPAEGVEHRVGQMLGDLATNAFVAVMPEGVEHQVV